MLKNTIFNRKATLMVARALGELNESVVYVGGAMVSLYIDDPAAEDIRPTKDIDITFEIKSSRELENLREELVVRGFKQSHEDKIICRFRMQEIKVDVMSTTSIGWAPSNRWFQPGFDHAFTVTIEDVMIKIMPLPYFLATKIEAFYGRGAADPLLSHDYEDIVYLLNYTSSISEQINDSDRIVRQFIKDFFQKITLNRKLMESMRGHLYFEETDERMEIIMERINEVVNGI